MHCKGCSYKSQICSWIFHEQKKRLNLSDKLFIVNYLLSSILCMCTVFINLTGILVVPWKEAQCKFCIFRCNFQFVSPYVFWGWNSTLPHNSWWLRLFTKPTPHAPPERWASSHGRLPSSRAGVKAPDLGKERGTSGFVKAREATLAVRAGLWHRRVVAAGWRVQVRLAGCSPHPTASQKGVWTPRLVAKDPQAQVNLILRYILRKKALC